MYVVDVITKDNQVPPTSQTESVLLIEQALYIPLGVTTLRPCD